MAAKEKLYIIGYDLKWPIREYEEFFAHLGMLAAYPLLEELWLVRSESTARQILEQLRPLLSSGDRLLIVEVGQDRIAFNPKTEIPDV